MKAKRDHRVQLSGRAVEVVRAARRLGDGTGLVFPSQRGKALTDRALSQLVRKQGIGAVPHGFRSSFRDWASERTDHPREVIEAALAHVVRNQTEAAYARSDLFERRRHLMDDWMQYLDSERGQMAERRRAAREPPLLRDSSGRVGVGVSSPRSTFTAKTVLPVVVVVSSVSADSPSFASSGVAVAVAFPFPATPGDAGSEAVAPFGRASASFLFVVALEFDASRRDAYAKASHRRRASVRG